MDDLFLERHELRTVHGLHALLWVVSLVRSRLHVWHHSLWWTVLAAFEGAFLGAVRAKERRLALGKIDLCSRWDSGF